MGYAFSEAREPQERFYVSEREWKKNKKEEDGRNALLSGERRDRMDGVDPDTLLEWLQTGVGDERDIQLMALEQLCMLLLMSDNIDRCFESCP
uniref:E3 ubiquitin-protein ligase n=1 Tax=Plectus sambesii TaxID=2011161 RepID=A0A914WAU0_9BILA